jgi:RNA polymerase sigma factor (sigma-70 family)
MKITAITRYKHGELYAVLNRMGWTQAELARRSGINQRTIGAIINLSRRPSQNDADAIQKALGDAGEYFDVLEQWPETFEGLKRGIKKEETLDVPMECLIGCREAMMLPAPSERQGDRLAAAMDAAMEDLTEQEKAVLEARFFDGKTQDEVGTERRLSRASIGQIEAKALRKLRHPERLRHLEQFAPSCA